MGAPNHLDNRRKLLPRHYFPDGGYGRDGNARLAIPPGGDEVSARIAYIGHQLLVAWTERGRKPSGAELARRYGCSKSVFSEAALGERWLCATLTVALLEAIRHGR